MPGPDYRAIARQASVKYGVDPNFFEAQIKQESGFNPSARSGAGAIGIAQIVPKYHPGVDPRDPIASLDYAAKYMSGLQKKYGNYEQALSVYNSGRPDAYKDPNFAKGQTYNYVKSIMGSKRSPSRGTTIPVDAVQRLTEDIRTPDIKKQHAQDLLDFALGVSKGGDTAQLATKLLGQTKRLVSSQGSLTPPRGNQAVASEYKPGLSGAVADKVLAAAHNEVGKPYQWGSGPSTESFDCSDLIQYAYKQVGINLPRVTYDQIKVGHPVKWGEFQPGDLIFSHNGGHVVMYVGGGKVIAAPHTGTVVQYQPVSRFKDSFTTARRVL